MTGLSLMNPWHAARTLLNPEVPEELRYGPIEGMREQRSIMDEMNPLAPEFFKDKFRSFGPMFKKGGDERENLKNYFLKYSTFGKRSGHNAFTDMIEDTRMQQKKNMEIMRFGKRGF